MKGWYNVFSWLNVRDILDGLDAVLCKIEEVGGETKVAELAFETFDFPEDLRLFIRL